MKKYILLMPLIFFVQYSSATSPLATDSKKVEPSSDIPDKREFPLNTEINPCDDFHGYVCSIAESRFKLRDDRRSHTFAFNDSRERLLEAKMNFMKNLPKEKKLSKRGMQIKSFYNSCMNIKARASEEKSKLSQIEQELARIKTPAQFITYLNGQTKKGEQSLIGFGDRPHLENPQILTIYMGVRLMDLPDHSYYEKPEVMAAYKELLVEFFKTAMPALKAEQAVAKAEQQIQLQKDFIKSYPVASIRRQRFSEKRTSTQSETISKFSNLKLNEIFKDAPKTAAVNIPIPESVEFLNSYMTTDKLNVLKDLYLYSTASEFMDEAYPKFYQSQFNFQKNFFGGPQVRPILQERCTNAISGIFTMELDQILIDRLFPGFNDEKVLELGSRIRGSIVTGLEKNTWLSTSAKTEAIKKISTAKLQLVRPQNDKEWDFLPIQKYSDVKFIENKRIHELASYKKSMEDMKHPANQAAWGMGPLTVNAYYNPSENKFVLPIGILQFPFYDKDGDLIENLGAVGAVVGHELGHSIDDQGSQFDASGKLNQWMTMQDKAEFSKRGQKMVDLFDKAGHDGKLTLGENVADLVGMTFAYQAAFPDSKGSVEDKKRFFTSYGRLWCSVSRPDFEKMLLKTDPHALGRARINEQVKHQPAFFESFNCDSKNKLYLSEKNRVQIW
jgi:putative endopeptidase